MRTVKKKYSVGVFFRFEGEENARMYDFTFIGRVRDNYTLLIKLRNEDLCLDTELKFTIHFIKITTAIFMVKLIGIQLKMIIAAVFI